MTGSWRVFRKCRSILALRHTRLWTYSKYDLRVTHFSLPARKASTVPIDMFSPLIYSVWAWLRVTYVTHTKCMWTQFLHTCWLHSILLLSSVALSQLWILTFSLSAADYHKCLASSASHFTNEVGLVVVTWSIPSRLYNCRVTNSVPLTLVDMHDFCRVENQWTALGWGSLDLAAVHRANKLFFFLPGPSFIVMLHQIMRPSKLLQVTRPRESRTLCALCPPQFLYQPTAYLCKSSSLRCV